MPAHLNNAQVYGVSTNRKTLPSYRGRYPLTTIAPTQLKTTIITKTYDIIVSFFKYNHAQQISTLQI